MKYIIFFMLAFSMSLMANTDERKKRHQEIVQKFDKDGDGRLSQEEHEEVRKHFEKERETRQQRSGEKRAPRQRVDESFLKSEIISLPSSLEKEVTTLRNEFILFQQVNKSKKAPLIIYLHGGGGQNGPTNRHVNNAIAPLISSGKYPFNLLIPIFKKSPDMPNGWNPDDLTKLLKYVIVNYNIDSKRIYVTGHSMGGAGTLMWGNKYPELLTAIAPSAAGGSEEPKGDLPVKAENFKDLPMWAFHGSKDGVCDYNRIEKLTNQVNKLGGKAKFTLFDGVGHNLGPVVHNDDKVLKWFLEQ